MMLTVDPIPPKNWGINLAHMLPKDKWDMLRKNVYRQYGHKCGICEMAGRMNCHELWRFDDDEKIQKLVGFVSLCDMCHDVSHWFRTECLFKQEKITATYMRELVTHFMRINRCSQEEFNNYILQVGKTLQQRDQFNYKIEFGIYLPSNLKVKRVSKDAQ